MKRAKKIACIGDSITYGAGVQKEHAHNTWEYFLQEKVGDTYQVLNYGINGRTLQDEGDYPYRKEKFYQISHDIKADIYILMLGTNDAKPYNWDAKRFQSEYRTFVDSYTNLENHPTVYVMTPPKAFVDPKTGIVGYDIIAEIIDDEVYPIVQKFAHTTNTKWIDLFNLTKTHPDWFADGVHPNAKGNQEIAECIFEHIK